MEKNHTETNCYGRRYGCGGLCGFRVSANTNPHGHRQHPPAHGKCDVPAFRPTSRPRRSPLFLSFLWRGFAACSHLFTLRVLHDKMLFYRPV